MRKPRNSRIVLALTSSCILAAGGVYAATGGASDGQPGVPARLAVLAPGPGHLLRAEGASITKAKQVFTLADGDELSVASGPSGRCLLRRRKGKPAGEACASEDGIEAGHGISVADECGYSGQNRMQITGLAPEGVRTVRLQWSDGTNQETEVIDGAFRFEGHNPAASEPYPTGVQWIAANGSSEESAPLPVNGAEFCLPAEEP